MVSIFLHCSVHLRLIKCLEIWRVPSVQYTLGLQTQPRTSVRVGCTLNATSEYNCNSLPIPIISKKDTIIHCPNSLE